MDELTASEFLAFLDDIAESYGRYEALLDRGVTRELARIGLPTSLYTEWYWKCDLRNIMHFLSLRMDAHAQLEIRDYAYAMYALIEPIAPIAMEAFVDYRFESLHLSRLEVDAIRRGVQPDTTNKRELAEWEAKRGRLGL